jgi:hypothetical protein
MICDDRKKGALPIQKTQFVLGRTHRVGVVRLMGPNRSYAYRALEQADKLDVPLRSDEPDDERLYAEEAALPGYLWAKAEAEIKLKPIATEAIKAKKKSEEAGKKSGDVRRKNAEQRWVKIAKILAIEIRDKQPELSQDDLAFEIGVLWASDTKQPGSARIEKLIGEIEKSGRAPKTRAKA